MSSVEQWPVVYSLFGSVLPSFLHRTFLVNFSGLLA